MIHAYVNRIKQVAILLNYDAPQILELFKTPYLAEYIGFYFAINNLGEAVDAVKRVLTKEKIDSQLSDQSSASTPFMKVGDVHHSNRKTASFGAQNLIREQLDNLNSMVYNMSMQKEGNNRSFKPQIHQKRKRGQNQQNFRDRDRNRSPRRDRVNYRQNYRPNYRRQSQDR